MRHALVFVLTLLGTPAVAGVCDQEYRACLYEARDEFFACKGACDDSYDACAATCSPGLGGLLCRIECEIDWGMCTQECRYDARASVQECRALREACESCEEGTTWDVGLDACCPDAIWIADCFCPAGSTYVEEPVYDDQSCLLGIGCHCEPGPCSDGTELLCDMLPPECPEGTIVAVQDSCYTCVRPDTCEAPSSCDDGGPLLCDALPPECPAGLDLAVQDGCWACVDPYSCEPLQCSDGSDLVCRALPPDCPDGSVLSIQDGCWECVDPVTCAPPCEEGATWDPDLGACCSDAIWIADCFCEAGYHVITFPVHDDAGCLLGYGCDCERDCSPLNDRTCQAAVVR
jgi:hypothetical protein